MAPVRWTPQAADDLEAIAAFIARDSPHFAGLFVADIPQAVDRLTNFPESGRVVPEIGEKQIRKVISAVTASSTASAVRPPRY